MPRVCTVCAHPEREAIESQIVNQIGYRDIARRYRVSKDALARHRADHLPETLLRAQEAEETAEAVNVLAELRRASERLTLLFNACDAWLRDAEDPTRYDIGPRADEVTVTYLEPTDDGRKVRKKAKLSALLSRIEGHYEVLWGETKYADPRELVLKTYDRIEGQLELVAKLIGQLDERPQINVLVSPEWLRVRGALTSALEGYPEARTALAGALLTIEANEYRN